LLKPKHTGFLAFQQKDPVRRVPNQRWNELDDKKYNPNPHEMNQDHDHVGDFRIEP